MYETGGMRRLHLRGSNNALKRLLIQGAAFNLGLVMRKRLGAGTPRGLTALLAHIFALTCTHLAARSWLRAGIATVARLLRSFERSRPLNFHTLSSLATAQ
jgi:hypothetical protein